jgi:hypothetical protein
LPTIIFGRDKVNSARAITGPRGEQGEAGATGATGAAGANGMDGANGADGVPFNVDVVAPYADRGSYDNEPDGFVFLAEDGEAGGGPPAVVYIMGDGGAGDWSGAVPFQGPTGEAGASAVPVYTVHTTAGGVTVSTTVDLVVVKKSTGEATAVTLPSAAGRERPYTIKDGKGDSDTNNITVIPSAGEVIDSYTTASLLTLNFPYSSVTIYPYPDGTGWFIA